MSKQASPGLIGLFVIGAVALMTAAVLLIGSGSLFKTTHMFATYFEGSVVGLQKGSAVLFRGVPVGSVAEVFASIDRESLELAVTVVLEIDGTAVRDPSGLPADLPTEAVVETLVDRGLRTKLIIESLVTGQLAVELDFYPDAAAVYRGPPDSGASEIPSVPSDLQRIQEVLSGLVGRIENLQLEEVIATATRTLDSIDRLASSERVASILEGADALINSQHTQRLTADLSSAVASLEATLGDARALLARVDERLDPVLVKLGPLVEQLGQTLAEARTTLEATRALTGEDSELIYRAKETLEEMEGAMRSLRVLLDSLERHPEALLWGKAKP